MERIAKMNQLLEHALTFASKDRERTRHSLAATHSLRAACGFLMLNNGTVDWCGPEKDVIGYETIYQYMAGEFFAKDGKFKAKADCANEQAHIMRNGVNALRERWLELCGEILFVIPRYSNRREIQVITIDPDYVVNATGQTAADVYFERDMKSMNGQMRGLLGRGCVLKGKDEVKREVLGHVLTLLDSVPQYPTHPIPLAAIPGPSAH